MPPSSSAPQQQQRGSGGYGIAPLYKLGQVVAGDGRSSGGRDWRGQQQSFDSRGGGCGGGYAPFLPQGGAGDRVREPSRFGERDRPPPPPLESEERPFPPPLESEERPFPPPLESEERPFPNRSLPYNGPNGRAEWPDDLVASGSSFGGPRGPASGGGPGDFAPRHWGGDSDCPRGGSAAGGGTSYCSGGGRGGGLRDWSPPSHQGGGQQQGRDWPRRDDDDGGRGGWHDRRSDRLPTSADRSPIGGGGRFVESAVIDVYNLVWRRGDDFGAPELEEAAEGGAAATVEAVGAGAADPANADTSAAPPAAAAAGSVATPAAAPPPTFGLVVSHDSLYNLFCNYGSVVRIKLLLRPPHIRRCTS